jgi:anaerobic magnesium-protoporphyrin IX monomethyl ester cyclase
MKVLLIHPPSYKGINLVRQGRCLAIAEPGIRVEFPVFLAYVASILRENGHSVAVVDAMAEGLPLASLSQRINRFAPDTVIVETVPSTYEGDKVVADIAKQINRQICTIYYGWQASARPNDVLDSQNIDYVIRGEPECTALEFLNALEHNGNLEDVKGLSFRKNGFVRHNPSRPLNNKLDTLPYPARDLFRLEKYFAIPFGKITTVVASRGCPYSCIYCPTHLIDGRDLRFRHPEKVADEVESIVNKFKIRTIFFYADNFTLWGNRNIVYFCKEVLARKLNIRWLINSRIDTLPSENTLRYMAKSGCFLIQFGVESCSLRMLEAMKKGRSKIECEQYVKAIQPSIERAKKVGILTKVNLLIGFTGEDQQTVDESVHRMKEYNPDLSFNFGIPIPFPGTELGRIAEEKGLLPPDGEGRPFDKSIALKLFAIANNTEPNRILELQKRANYAVKQSLPKKLKLAIRLTGYFARKGDIDILLNVGRAVIKEKGRVGTLLESF